MYLYTSGYAFHALLCSEMCYKASEHCVLGIAASRHSLKVSSTLCAGFFHDILGVVQSQMKIISPFPSNCSKPVQISFFCQAQKKIFWRMLVTKVDSSHWLPSTQDRIFLFVWTIPLMSWWRESYSYSNTWLINGRYLKVTVLFAWACTRRQTMHWLSQGFPPVFNTTANLA